MDMMESLEILWELNTPNDDVVTHMSTTNLKLKKSNIYQTEHPNQIWIAPLSFL